MRLARLTDIDTVIDLVVSAGMFERSETQLLRDMMGDYFETEHAEGHRFVVLEHDGTVVGVAYYQPRAATDRVWDLNMIAVRPSGQRQGYGAQVLGSVETDLRERGQRLLIVETSAMPQYQQARAFYLKAGFDEEARVRDYWEAGDDLVIFRKSLAIAEGATR